MPKLYRLAPLAKLQHMPWLPLVAAAAFLACDGTADPTAPDAERIVPSFAPSASSTTSSDAAQTGTFNPDGLPQGTGENVLEVLVHEGSICYLVTFEGGGDFEPIHPENGFLVPGTPVRFDGNWGTISASFFPWLPALPSGDVFALFGFEGSNVGTLTFEEPVARVSLAHLSFTDLTLDAYDASGALVASTSAPAESTAWNFMQVDAGSNVIVRAEVVTPGLFEIGIDDLDVCIEAVREVAIDVKPGNDADEIDPLNLKSQGSLPLAILSSSDFDATAIDVTTLLLGDPLLAPRAGVTSSSSGDTATEDVNADGLVDLVAHFDAAALVDGGAIDAGTTEVELTGVTTGGEEIHGVDQVRIVGGGS